MPATATAAIALSLLAAGASAAPARGPWILTCDMPARSAAAAGDATGSRTFRVGPKLLQEWNPDTKKFGANLCASYACSVDSGRVEGRISTSSLILAVRVDRKTGAASWRTIGASTLKKTSGACSVKPDAAKAG